ncbi:uncharacterized protein LOC133137724 [Conger conger]|uniref:uncharacterized protein LOC133137724 n=1 Tax=Conger conger TaxID=82655 RepID=UPI002A59E804|nr:uncharacterized protein LOC133137724 [Conger conger]
MLKKNEETEKVAELQEMLEKSSEGHYMILICPGHAPTDPAPLEWRRRDGQVVATKRGHLATSADVDKYSLLTDGSLYVKNLRPGDSRDEHKATEPIETYPVRRVRRYTFGRKDPKKRTRTILMVGESLIHQDFTTQWITRKIKSPLRIYKFFKSLNNMEQIDAACIVVKASETVLTSGQKYIFDTVLSLLGKNMEKNIVTLFTFSHWMPPSALKAVIKSGVPVPKDDNDEHVYFQFNNLPVEKPAKKYEQTYKTCWDKGTNSFKEFFKALDLMETESLRVIRKVLKQRQSLEDPIQRLERITDVEETSKELGQERKTLEKLREDMKKERVEINGKATCCTVCEVNCHYPGCWWVNDLSWCSVMKDGKRST